MKDKLFVFIVYTLIIGGILYLVVNESARIEQSSQIKVLERDLKEITEEVYRTSSRIDILSESYVKHTHVYGTGLPRL